METSILQQIRKKAGSLIEPQLLKTGKVLAVRTWNPATMIEVDLHLPLVNMRQWQEVPYIKFRVDDLTYRDYTPSGWDVETNTCTIFINTAHAGAGSLWSRQLRAGHTVQYLKTGTTHQATESAPAIAVLGDESSVGHLLALQQMAPTSTKVTGAVLIDDQQTRRFFGTEIKSPIEPLARTEQYGAFTLMQWIDEQQYNFANTAFFITGNNMMVTQLRKLLRIAGVAGGNIRAQGFWH